MNDLGKALFAALFLFDIVGASTAFAGRSIDVIFDGCRSQVQLAGTLTFPEAAEPGPAVVLLTVAGPNDRDMAYPGHKPFETLANELAAQGIVSLRMDDRGVGGSSGDLFETSYDDLGCDANSALTVLETLAEVDAERTGIIGISEGGAIGPIASVNGHRADFLVLLSPPGLQGVETIRAQLRLTLEQSGQSEQAIAMWIELYERFLDLTALASKGQSEFEELVAFLKGPGRPLVPPYVFVPADPVSQAKLFSGNWYQSQLHFDPGQVLEDVSVPVLVVSGSLDPVSPPALHHPAIENALERGKATDYSMMVLEGHNHLLQRAKTGSPLEYAKIEDDMSPVAVEEVVGWVLVNSTSGRSKP
jgi:uncharacterized protein